MPSSAGARSLTRRGGDDRVEATDDLVRVAHVRREVEDRVEVESRQLRIGCEQLAQRRAAVQCLLGDSLDDPVGVVAAHAPRDQREQHALGEQRAVGQLEVLAHARRR